MKNKTYLTILLASVLFLGISLNVYAKEHMLSFPAGESFIEQELSDLEKEFSRLSFERKKLSKEIDMFYRRRIKNTSRNNNMIEKFKTRIVSLNLEIRAYEKRNESLIRFRQEMGQ